MALPRRFRLHLNDLRLERDTTRAAKVGSVERLERVRAFYGLYEDAVEVLLAATTIGASASLQERYDGLRRVVLAEYGPIKPYLLAYLRMTVADAEYGLAHFGRPSDAFEILFGQEELSTLLATDDGEMIRRITRTREALTLYAEHLRFLIENRPS
ncbi:hypothetical protein EON77_02075 [bacterium]|nr:MAG: hypothetical protein EON77_02075 [bacterium]